MSLIVNDPNPLGLLHEIKRKIDAGIVRTWAYNEEGYFTHKAPQWKERAWLRPIPVVDALHFEIVLPKGEVKQDVEGHYKARFTAMLWNHFGHEVIESSTHKQPSLSSKSAPRKRSRAEATAKRRRKNISRPMRTRTLRAGKVKPIAGKKR